MSKRPAVGKAAAGNAKASPRPAVKNADQPKPRIGFIGVGLMGHGMAKNLVQKGFPLKILGHRNRKPVADLVRRGAKEVKTPAALAKASDIVFICAPSSVEVEDLVRRRDGLKAGGRRGLIIIDTTTSDPTSTLALAAELKKAGIKFVDAPLTRTPKEAEAGKLNTLVGGDATTFRKIKPALEAWAENVFHVGPVGNGHKLKLINNFIAMGFVSVIAEALTTAQKSGVDIGDLNDVVSAGPISNGIYQNVMEWIIGGDRNAHKFTLVNSRKDIRYYNRLAESVDSTAVVGSAARQLFEIANNLGYGDNYLPQLCDAVAEVNKVKLR